MASLVILSNPVSDIEYSILDGRVKSFELKGVKMFDEVDGTAIDGWKQRLAELVIAQGLDVDRDGIGLHAFVYRLQEDGALP